MPAKILVLSASVGAGHMRAAQAVELALRELAAGRRRPERRRPHAHQRRVSQGLRRGVPRPRQQGAARPRVLLRPAWIARRSRGRSATGCGWLWRSSTCRSFCDLLECERWDVVVNTHFLPAEIIALAEEARKLNLPQMTVTTDFETHSPVGEPAVRRVHCSATDEGGGVPAIAGACRQTASPSPASRSTRSSASRKIRAECLQGRRASTATGRSCCNWPAGSASGRSRSSSRSMLSIETPLEVVVVAGKNEKAEGSSSKRSRCPPRHRLKVIGLHRRDRRADGRRRRRRHQARRADHLRSRSPAAPRWRSSTRSPARKAATATTCWRTAPRSRSTTSPRCRTSWGNSSRIPKRLQQLKGNARKLGKPQAAFDVAKLALSSL